VVGIVQTTIVHNWHRAQVHCFTRYMVRGTVHGMQQDVGLPFMLQEQLEDDILYLVFEEDWRLFPEEGSRSAVPAYGGQSTIQRHGGTGFLHGRMYHVPTRYPAEVEALDSRKDITIVDDLVSMVTAARRHGGGDLVWMTWQPGQGNKVKRTQSICSGSMLLALTKAGARRVLQGMKDTSIPKDHFDISLLWFLQEHGRGWASYILPPVGNYKSHVSGTEPSFTKEERPDCWQTPWVCPGTRTGHDDKKRVKWVCFFKKRGTPDYLGKFDIEADCEKLWWLTFWAVPDKLRPDLQRAIQGGGRGKLAPEPTAGTNHQGVSPAASSNDKTSRETRRQRKQKLCLGWRKWADRESEADVVMKNDRSENTVVSNDTADIRGSRMPRPFRPQRTSNKHSPGEPPAQLRPLRSRSRSRSRQHVRPLAQGK
jgi:hypothetical protein